MSSRPALAVSLYVARRRCLVVGDGPIADDRVARLRAAGAEVAAVPAAGYRPELTDGAFLVFCCDAARAEEVSRDARARGALVWCLDQPELSDLAMPALARRGTLQLAISTDGDAPALARRLREELERLLADAGPALDALLAEMAARRAALPPGVDRRDALGPVADRLRIEGRIVVE